METPVVSVIMPVYNAEAYVGKAIESVCNQTFQDWELLLVNDCSTDNSLDICKERSLTESRIKVISLEKNSGPAVVRNVGMDNATGKYLSFIDSDDSYKADFLQKMVNTAEHYSADVVWCNLDEVSDEGCIVRSHGLPCDRILEKKGILKTFFMKTTGLGSMCNKLYLRSAVKSNHLRINEKRVRAEDWEFNLMVFQKADKVVAIKDSLYSYIRQNSGSVMSTYRKQDFNLMCHSQELLSDMAIKYHLDVNQSKFWGEYLYNVISYLPLMYRNEPQCNEFLREILNNGIFNTALYKGSYKELPIYYKALYWSIRLKLRYLTRLLLQLK